MNDIDERFDRNVRLFGIEGQRRLRESQVAVVGVGGLGSHVVQQLALLGVGAIALIDDEDLSITNRNRYIGCNWDDPIPGTAKVTAARRLISAIDPSIAVTSIHSGLVTGPSFDAIRSASHLFGCLDHDGPRFVLNDIATAHAKPFIDLASDIADQTFGGRIVTNWIGDGCLFCLGELDLKAVQDFLETSDERLNRKQIYGVDRSFLDEAGPSVVSVNGVIASMAVTEFMVARTEMGMPKKFINYNGRMSRAFVRDNSRSDDCPYCSQWGTGDRADVGRYLRISVGRR